MLLFKGEGGEVSGLEQFRDSSIADHSRRLKATHVEHRDFIWYILKQAEKFDLKHDVIIANSGLFMYVPFYSNPNIDFLTNL